VTLFLLYTIIFNHGIAVDMVKIRGVQASDLGKDCPHPLRLLRRVGFLLCLHFILTRSSAPSTTMVAEVVVDGRRGIVHVRSGLVTPSGNRSALCHARPSGNH
jgi:hypothetical protein